MTFLKMLLRRVKYFGTAYRCSLCGAWLNRFLWTGTDNEVTRAKKIVGGGRRQTLCPVCFSTDRDRLVWLFLRRRLKIHELHKAKLLHIAPERQVRRRLRALGNIGYVSGDRFEEGYEYPKDTVPLDVARLPFRTAVFDVVICNHVLEHIPNDGEAMRELRRVMKPGGVAILQVPISRELAATYEDERIRTATAREAEFGQHDHRRLYGQDYEKRLQTTGFVVQRIRPQDEEASAIINREALNPDEEIFAARRPHDQDIA